MIGKAVFGESSHIEFKRELPKRHENFLKDVIAFANTSGGKIILGVQDNGTVTGIGDMSPFRLSDAISNMISDACIPQINTEITIRTVEAKTVLEVEVFPGKFRPYFLASAGKKVSCYIRINGTSRPADERKIQELEMEGKNLSYDTIPLVGVPYDEQLAKELCEQMYQTAISACRTDEECHAIKPMTLQKLETFSILHRNGHKLMPTHAFELLTKPTDTFVKIQCAVFKGNDRAVFIDRKEFVGAIQKQVEEAYQFVLTHIHLKTEIGGLYRRDFYELPSQSIREVIANAVLHRSYLDPSCIQVSIYDNRVEVDSPGMLYDGLTIEDAVKGKSKCRNPAIAVAFQYMKIVEAWGTGLPRLFQQCKELGLPEPRLEEFGDGIKVTMFRRQAIKTSDKRQATKGKRQKASDKRQAIKTNGHVQRIRTFLRSHGESKTSEIAEYLGLGMDRTRVLLKGMAEVLQTGSNRDRRYRLKSSDARNSCFPVLSPETETTPTCVRDRVQEQATRTSDKKQAIKNKRQRQAIKTNGHVQRIRTFLRSHGESKTSEIAEYLGLGMDRTRVLLKGMAEVLQTGANRDRRYRLG